MMTLRTRDTAALLLLVVPHVAAWTVTNYLFTSESLWPGESTSSTLTTTVLPTGSVTPISTNVSTTVYAETPLGAIGTNGKYIVTVTDLYLAPNASACTNFDEDLQTTCKAPSYSALATQAITTRYFAPVLIQNPSSCTKTSFSYTSSTAVYPMYNMPSLIFEEATASSEALFVTTYVVTLSTDLGGQAVTTTYADVYLDASAVVNITVLDPTASFLSQCIDPSSALCGTVPVTVTDVQSCEIGVPITYPPTAPSGGGPAGTTGGSGSAATTSSKSGAAGVTGLVDAKAVLAFAGLAAAYLM